MENGVLVYEGVLCAVPYTYIGKVSSNCNCLWVFLFPSSLSRCATVRLRGLGVTLVGLPRGDDDWHLSILPKDCPDRAHLDPQMLADH